MSTIVTHLRADGVSLLVQLQPGHLPQVLHWGADLGQMTTATARALAAGEAWMVAPNTPEEPLRLGLLPEARFGWMGTPGLIGSRRGRDWSPAWNVIDIRLEGQPVTDGYHERPGGSLEVTAVGAGLELVLTLRLLPQGLVRTRARLTNRQDEPYQLEALNLALPVPSAAREILDLAG
ncbi:MAG: glycoside hydrolase family 36 N-terminal domain-containing protein, partial [Propioniciclava sp.]